MENITRGMLEKKAQAINQMLIKAVLKADIIIKHTKTPLKKDVKEEVNRINRQLQ